MKSHLLPNPGLEYLPEALEKMNMLCLFAGKLEKGPDAVVVSGELNPRVVYDVR